MSRSARPSGRKAIRGHGELLAALIVFALTAFTYSSVPEDHSAPSLGAGSVLYVPAAAHATGANGSNWRTDMQVHNPGSGSASFTVQLLMRDANNSSPASKSYTLAAQQSRRFRDVLDTEFGVSGAAALRVTITSGSLLVSARTYNLIGVNPWNLPQGSSFGQYERAWNESLTIGYGQEGRLIQLTQQPAASLDGFRTNVGIVNTSAIPIDVRIDCYRSNGTWLGKKDGGDTSLPPYGFRQLNEMLKDWGTVSDGYAIVKTTTPGGRLLAFASVNDNHNSGDPIFVPAAVMTSSGPAPTPTPTPTPTLTPTTAPSSRPNLFLHKPSGWASCFSLNYQSDCCDDTSCCSPFLSTSYSAFVELFLANSGSATLTGPVRFALSIDGAIVGYANWSNGSGLAPGYGAILSWKYDDDVSPGTHAVTVTIDPDNTIVESNEGDNSCTRNATWTTIVFGRSKPASENPPEVQLSGGAVVPLAGAMARKPLSVSSASIYVPASAHNSGQNGSNWRTDLEVHNPGSTATTFTVDLLMQSTDNGGAVPTQTFSLGPQQSVRYVDILASVFGVTGAAAIRVTPLSGGVLVTSRTYNLIGANNVGLPVGASFGQFVPGLPETEAAGYGEEARLIQLTHRAAASMTDFRSNVGILNTTGSPIDLRLDLFTASGSLVGTVQDARTHLRAYESVQINNIFGGFTSWLEDGYVVVRTTTPGGRFFAFASVNDNHVSGDPIFITAVKMAGSTPPTGPTPTPTRTATPTPTPTLGPPVSGTQPLGTIETINDIMTGLGLAGTGNIPTIDAVVHDVQTRGIDAIIGDFVSRYPTRVSRVPGGAKVDFGTGYTLDDGTVLKGQVTATLANASVTAVKVTGNFSLTSNNFTKNGAYPGIQSASGSVNLNVTPQGKVNGDVTINGSGTTPAGNTTISGTVHVDTATCPKYPVGGTVTVLRGSDTRTITFTPACDGSYIYGGSGYSPYLFDGMLLKCDGTPQSYGVKISLAAEGDHLTVNPTCGRTGGVQTHQVTGTKTPTSVRFAFRNTVPGDRTHVYQGIFNGTSTNGGVSYEGTSTFTVTVYQGSSMACTSPPYQKQGTLWLNTAAPCWP